MSKSKKQTASYEAGAAVEDNEAEATDDREEGDATKETDRAVADQKRQEEADQSSQDELRQEATEINKQSKEYAAWLKSPLTAELRDWAKDQLKSYRRICENATLKPKEREVAVFRLDEVKLLMGELHKPVLRARELKAQAADLGTLFASSIDAEVKVDLDVALEDLPAQAVPDHEDEFDDEGE